MLRIAITTGLIASALVAGPARADDVPHIDAAVAQLPGIITDGMAKTGVPGLAVAVVSGDQVVYSQGFGVRSTKTDEPVTVVVSSTSISRLPDGSPSAGR